MSVASSRTSWVVYRCLFVVVVVVVVVVGCGCGLERVDDAQFGAQSCDPVDDQRVSPVDDAERQQWVVVGQQARRHQAAPDSVRHRHLQRSVSTQH